MSRKERRKEPALTPKERVELSQKNIPLRIVLAVLALVLAGVCFANALDSSTAIPAGWQEIAPANPQTYAAQDFVLSYNLGAGQKSPKAELQALAPLYTKALDAAYRSLANEPVEGVSNLYTLNTQPNTEVRVNELLYDALGQLEASGSRRMYYAPMADQYLALFACTYDEEAEQFDPTRNPAAAAFAAEIAAFAQDAASVRLVLLPEQTVRLEVSEEYLTYARENAVESFVDFGVLRNALLCDAVADALAAQGYENGVVSSLDGYTRNLCSQEFALNIFDMQEGKAKNLGAVVYTGPAALVSFRAFPLGQDEAVNYFTYSDGTVVPPYLAENALSHTAASNLSTISKEGTVTALALKTLSAFTGDDAAFPALAGISWASAQGGQIRISGGDFTRFHQ